MSRRPDPAFWAGRRVFLTGHTGFKGAWARVWLEAMGARVTGYALAPETDPSLHLLLGDGRRDGDSLADIRDQRRLTAALAAAAPEIVLHMAAQPLVRRGYAEPVETFEVNVMGTVALLEAARVVGSVSTILVVTTDKVYHNDESGRAFREGDRLGGHDPYSGSKAACELVVETYRASYLGAAGIGVATARGGNVLGGGDFSADRLVPDVVRAALSGARLEVRNPTATRPWQHVLDCLAGYFVYVEAVAARRPVPSALNFGPGSDDPGLAVGDLVAEVQRGMGLDVAWSDTSDGDHPREMGTLGLDPSAAAAALDWRPRLDQRAIAAWTARWYDGWRRGGDARRLTLDQIEAFMAGA